MLSRLGLWWQRWKTRRKMNRVFSRGADPYGYRSSSYEKARLEAMARCLGDRRYGKALEAGCAEGVFTARILESAVSIDAVDISRVALDRARARIPSVNVSWFEADLRDWASPSGGGYDLVVLGDVLYYLDKPLVQREFEAVIGKVARWLNAGGRLILAHGFAGGEQLSQRRGFRERFQREGLRLVDERVIEGDAAAGGVSCLLSVLER